MLNRLLQTLMLIAVLGSAPDADAEVPSLPHSGVVARGRVEPVSEEILIGSSMAGRLHEVLVGDGDKVVKGQILAVIENEYLAARVAAAEAQVKIRRSELARLMAGARDQDRRVEAAAVKQAEVSLAGATVSARRQEALLARNAVTREAVEQAEQERRLSEVRLELARERLSALTAPPRPEDVARQEAEIELAEAQLAEARALLRKSVIRAPIDGVILRHNFRVGEMVPESGPTPLFVIAQTSRLNVRVEIEDRDVSGIRPGLEAVIVAPALGDKRFGGRATWVAGALLRKKLRTDDPADRQDVRVLEALVNLDQSDGLLPGMLVECFFEPAAPIR